MFFYLGMFFALSLLGRCVFSAPVPDTQSELDTKDMEDIKSSEFQECADSAVSLVTKILHGIPAVHKALVHTTTLSLDESDLSTLQYLKESLSLPEPSPLHPLSVNFKLDVSLDRIVEGLELHRVLLTVICELAHVESEKLNGLLADLRDAVMHVHKMQDLIKAENRAEEVSESQLKQNLALKLKNAYVSQVATHLTLIQLRQFNQDVRRSLRSMIVSQGEDETQEA